MKKNDFYVGISLIFLCRKNNDLIVEKRSFVVSSKNLTEIKRKASELGEKIEKLLKPSKGVYLGINDIFEITGPLREGCILGRTTFWSYKNINKALTLFKKEREYGILKGLSVSQSRQFIAQMIYFINTPQHDFKRTISCYVLVNPTNRFKIKDKINKLGQSEHLRNKLQCILLRYEPNIRGNIIFIGVADINYVYEKVKRNNCFDMVYKKISSLSSAKELVFPISKFRNFWLSVTKQPVSAENPEEI